MINKNAMYVRGRQQSTDNTVIMRTVIGSPLAHAYCAFPWIPKMARIVLQISHVFPLIWHFNSICMPRLTLIGLGYRVRIRCRRVISLPDPWPKDEDVCIIWQISVPLHRSHCTGICLILLFLYSLISMFDERRASFNFHYFNSQCQTWMTG